LAEPSSSPLSLDFVSSLPLLESCILLYEALSNINLACQERFPNVLGLAAKSYEIWRTEVLGSR